MVRFLVVLLIAAIGYKIFFGRGSEEGGEAGGKAGGKAGGAFPARVISEATPVREIPAEKRVRVILFTGTEWCPPCRQLDQSVISKAPWKEFAEKEILFRCVDIPRDGSRAPAGDRELVSRYGVRSFPTMVIVDRSGRELARRSGGGAPVENYKAWIRGYADASS